MHERTENKAKMMIFSPGIMDIASLFVLFVCLTFSPGEAGKVTYICHMYDCTYYPTVCMCTAGSVYCVNSIYVALYYTKVHVNITLRVHV